MADSAVESAVLSLTMKGLPGSKGNPPITSGGGPQAPSGPLLLGVGSGAAGSCGRGRGANVTIVWRFLKGSPMVLTRPEGFPLSCLIDYLRSGFLSSQFS